jgi:hypothetical protein
MLGILKNLDPRILEDIDLNDVVGYLGGLLKYFKTKDQVLFILDDVVVLKKKKGKYFSELCEKLVTMNYLKECYEQFANDMEIGNLVGKILNK